MTEPTKKPKRARKKKPRPIPTGPHGCAACGAEPYSWHSPDCRFRE